MMTNLTIHLEKGLCFEKQQVRQMRVLCHAAEASVTGKYYDALVSSICRV